MFAGGAVDGRFLHHADHGRAGFRDVLEGPGADGGWTLELLEDLVHDVIGAADVIYVTRVQKERFASEVPSIPLFVYNGLPGTWEHIDFNLTSLPQLYLPMTTK